MLGLQFVVWVQIIRRTPLARLPNCASSATLPQTSWQAFRRSRKWLYKCATSICMPPPNRYCVFFTKAFPEALPSQVLKNVKSRLVLLALNFALFSSWRCCGCHHFKLVQAFFYLNCVEVMLVQLAHKSRYRLHHTSPHLGNRAHSTLL